MGKNKESYVEHYIETRNCIRFYVGHSGQSFYLKDYSKVVRGISSGLSVVPERFEDENITLIENPTDEEKVILATNLSSSDNVYLTAIIEGRNLLKTKSKEEAISVCEEKHHQLLNKILHQEEVTDEEMRLNRIVKSYLDGSLAKKSLEVLSSLSALSNALDSGKVELDMDTVEKDVVVDATDKLENQSTVQGVVPEVSSGEVSVEASQIVDVPMAAESNDLSKEMVSGSLEEAVAAQVEGSNMVSTAPGVQPVSEAPQAVVQTPVAQAGGSLDLDAYNKMVADVLKGDNTEEVTASQVPVEVPTVEVSVPQTAPTVQSVVPASVIPTPASLETMTEAPSFEGTLGGRTL